VRTRLIAVVTALLVVLAGCGGLGGDNGATTSPVETTTQGETATTTTAPDTTTANGTGTTATTDGPATTTTDETGTADGTTTDETTTASPGGDTSGDLPADAGQRHREALRSSGSFTVDTVYVLGNETQDFITSNTTSQLDLDTDRGYRNGTSALGQFRTVRSTYTDGDVTYHRTNNSIQTQYQRATAPYEGGSVQPVNFTTVVGQAANATSNVSYAESGTTTFDGVEVTRYEASGDALARELGGGSTDLLQNASVESASSTVLVDGDGVVRLMNFEVVFVGEDDSRATLRIEQRVTEVGSTTVSEPDWLDEAKEQTD